MSLVRFYNMDEIHIVCALLGGFILFFGLISLFVKERLFLSEALVAVVFGIIVGPIAFNFINPYHWSNVDYITLEFSRLVIGIQVMAAGVSLPKKYVLKEWKSLSVLLLLVMICMWMISAGLICAFFPLSFLESLVISACITPTDPVLANSIVKGKFAEKKVPIHLRDILSAESGANDGLGFPYMFFAIFLLVSKTPGEAMGYWFGMSWGYQIVLSIIVGILVGYVARKLLYYAERHELIDKESFLAFWMALALFLIGVMSMINSDDLLCCFVAGNSFTWDDWFRVETQEAHLQEVVDMIFNYSFFIYLGMIIPWSSFSAPEYDIQVWKLAVLAILILLFRRLPAIIAMYKIIPAVRTWQEAVFAGWFGPIGVGAIFYAMVAMEELETPEASASNLKVVHYLLPIVFFIVLSSIVVHGITIPLFYLGQAVKSRSIITTQTVQNIVSRLPTVRSSQDFNTRVSLPHSNLSKKSSVLPNESDIERQAPIEEISKDSDTTLSITIRQDGQVIYRGSIDGDSLHSIQENQTQNHNEKRDPSLTNI